MVLTRCCKKIFDKLHPVFNWMLTFSFVNVMWLFFRAESFSQAITILKAAFSWNFYLDPVFVDIFRLAELKKALSILRLEDKYPNLLITAFLLVALVLILGCDNAYEKMKKFKPTIWRWAVTVFLFAWCIVSFTGVSEFLYFNF